MILYIFGAGHGATELLEDSVYSKLFDSYLLVEDNPTDSSIVSTKSVLPKGYGIISAYYPAWKAKLDKDFPDMNWIKAVSPRANVLLKKLPVGLNVRSGAFVGSTAKIGRHVRLNFGSTVSYGCEIGDYSFLSIGTSMCGDAKVGIGSLIYAHAVILNGIKVGSNTIIGAGSVVTKDIPDNVVAYGNPCKVVRKNE